MFAPRRGKRVGLSRKMIRNRFSIMRSQLQRGCGVRRTRTRGENSHARGAQLHARDARWMRRSGKCVRDPPQRFFGDKLEDGREATGGTWERQGRKAGPQGRAGGEGPRRARSKWRREHHRASGSFGTTGPRRLSTSSSHVFNTSRVRIYGASPGIRRRDRGVGRVARRRRVRCWTRGAARARGGGGAGRASGASSEGAAAAKNGATSPCTMLESCTMPESKRWAEEAQGRDEREGAGPR